MIFTINRINTMKKYILLYLLFLFPIISSNADIIDDLIQSRSFYEWVLPFTFIIDDNNNFVVFFEGSGNYPSIMAYRFDNNILRFIIKKTYIGQEEPYPGELFESKYYLMEIKKENGEIKINCNIIKTLNLNNFIITKGHIIDNNVNIRLSPSTSGQRYSRQLSYNDNVKVISYQNYSRVNDMFDYWYGIEIDNKTLWIYGYFCHFVSELSIEDVRNKN